MGFLLGAFTRAAEGSTNIGPMPTTEFTTGTVIGIVVGYLLVIALFPFSNAAVLRAATSIALGERTGLVPALRGVLDRYWAIWGYLVVFGLFAIATIIPFPVLIWVGVPWWGVGLPALLVERVGPIRCLSRGFDLVQGHWWRTFGILALLFLLNWLVSYPIFILFGGLGFVAAFVPFFPTVVKGGLFYVGAVLSSALLLPIFELGRTMIYLDLRVRNEAYDLQRLAQEVAAAG
jgi:hypothetical protein